MAHNQFDTLKIFQTGIYMAQKRLFVHFCLYMGAKSQLRRDRNFAKCQTDFERLLSHAEKDLEGLEAAACKLWHTDLRLLIVSCGKAGCKYITPDFCGQVPGFVVEAVDTTGAGDGFVAGLLKGLQEHPQADQDENLLREICRYANAVGAITTTERGAIPALPTAEQVDRFIQTQVSTASK